MKNNKKGFTLIEMMVVIVIVAILVAVIIPIVNGSTVKAAAATNAANLRGVEGQLVAIMLSDPEAFDAANKASRDGEIVEEQDDITKTLERIKELEALIANEKATMELTDAAIRAANSTLNAVNRVVKYAGGDADSWSSVTIAAERASHTCSSDNLCKILQSPFVSWVGYSCKLDIKTTYVNAKTTLADENAIKTKVQAKLDDYNAELEELRGKNLDQYDNLTAEREGMYTYTAENGYITLDNGMKVEAPGAQKVKTDTVDCPVNTQMVVYVDTTNYVFDAVYVTYDKVVFQAIADEE